MAQTMLQAFLNAGFKAPKERKPREKKIQKCRVCGNPMEFIPNTNVMVCTGEFDVKQEDGTMKSVSCNHRYIFPVKN